MVNWDLAMRVFLLGFSGVFVTLALLLISILISGYLIRAMTKREG